jgi:hypothetical protein
MRPSRWLVWLVVLGILLVPALSFASTSANGGHARFERDRSSPAGWRTVTMIGSPLVVVRSASPEWARPAPAGHASPGHCPAAFVPPRSR